MFDHDSSKTKDTYVCCRRLIWNIYTLMSRSGQVLEASIEKTLYISNLNYSDKYFIHLYQVKNLISFQFVRYFMWNY